MTARPEGFSVQGRDWAIEDSDTLATTSDADGVCLYGTQTIILASMAGYSSQYAAEVLVHEVCHALFRASDSEQLVSSETEELIVSGLGKTVLDFIVSNPKLIRYIQTLYKNGE